METQGPDRLLNGVSGILKVRKRLGEKIRSLRTAAQVTQEKLAEKADLHPVYISQVERGEKAVSVEAVWKISKALRVSVSEVFAGI
jgi:transcriptional regulator with XRE-family HTH domain